MENIEDSYDALAKKELGAVLYNKFWALLWENTHLVKSRDYWLAIAFLETAEENRYLKNKLKPKPGSKEDLRVHENSNGTVQTGPYKAQLKENLIELRRLASELGLSPTSAANLKILNDTDKDAIQDVTKPLDRGI